MLKFRVTNSTKARRAAEAQRKALEEKVSWRGREEREREFGTKVRKYLNKYYGKSW